MRKVNGIVAVLAKALSQAAAIKGDHCEGGSNTWPRGVTVSTLDSESSDRGSNPREAFSHQLNAVALL